MPCLHYLNEGRCKCLHSLQTHLQTQRLLGPNRWSQAQTQPSAFQCAACHLGRQRVHKELSGPEQVTRLTSASKGATIVAGHSRKSWRPKKAATRWQRAACAPAAAATCVSSGSGLCVWNGGSTAGMHDHMAVEPHQRAPALAPSHVRCWVSQVVPAHSAERTGHYLGLTQAQARLDLPDDLRLHQAPRRLLEQRRRIRKARRSQHLRAGML